MFVHEKRSLYSTNALRIPGNLPEQYFFARVREAELLFTSSRGLIGFLMALKERCAELFLNAPLKDKIAVPFFFSGRLSPRPLRSLARSAISRAFATI